MKGILPPTFQVVRARVITVCSAFHIIFVVS